MRQPNPDYMPFGQYAGTPLEFLPDDYLGWLLSLPNIREPLRGRLLLEAKRRELPAVRVSRDAVEAIIAAGVKTLAKKHHPDVAGGNLEEMKNINHAADWIRAMVTKELTP